MKKVKNMYWVIALVAITAVAALVIYGQAPQISGPVTTTVPATTTVPTTAATTAPATTTAVVLAACSDSCASANYTAGNCRVSCYSWEIKVDATCDVEGQKCCCKK